MKINIIRHYPRITFILYFIAGLLGACGPPQVPSTHHSPDGLPYSPGGSPKRKFCSILFVDGNTHNESSAVIPFKVYIVGITKVGILCNTSRMYVCEHSTGCVLCGAVGACM